MNRADEGQSAPHAFDQTALVQQPFSCILQAVLAPPLDIADPALQIADPRISAHFAAAEARAEITRVRRTLTEREWSVLRDEYFNDLSQREIAASRGVSPAAIWKARRRALGKARRVLTGAASRREENVK